MPSTTSLTNGTEFLPPGAFTHGDPDLICVPTQWYDIAIFIVGNYIAHAATVVTVPGQSTTWTVLHIVYATLFPVTGFIMGLRTILRLALLGKTDLHKAARAGALIKVVRKGDYKSSSGEAIILSKNKLWKPSIHGTYTLPDEYAFALVPSNAEFPVVVGGPNGDLSPANISSTYSPVKTIVSIVQLIFAISTIYRSRGDQIDRFGYAAFGLTVIQYAIMSFINLVANMTCPQYSHLYMVETELMRNLRANSDAHFQGVVGILQEDADDVSGEENLAEKRYGRRRYIRLAWLPVGLLPTVLTLLIILGLTKFQPGSDSTETQLAASQIWLMFGGAVASMPDLRNGWRYYLVRLRLYENAMGLWIVYSNLANGISGAFVVQY
ncbi:uncharacterized protein TrAFT101_004016 [Trichoderma asperellum]|uniref:uncharacterized protein n=1 Tax=Trichoderma asperellum TaxID=101201 RepID=UPI00332C42D1|nr:hypothetical protein TrAFT101_004016 [Trichoderma asperellum]